MITSEEKYIESGKTNQKKIHIFQIFYDDATRSLAGSKIYIRLKCIIEEFVEFFADDCFRKLNFMLDY